MTANGPPPHGVPAAGVCAALGVDPVRGLTAGEARARLARHGANALARARPTPAWRRLLAQVQSPLPLLLVAATGVSGAVWWLEGASGAPYEAAAILAVLLLNAILGFVQERRAERAVAGLERLAAGSAQVVRDGAPRTVPARELVPGDIVLLDTGNTVPADGRLLEVTSLRTSEASLTGESAPVAKDPAVLPAALALADRANMVWSGTAVAYGRARVVVTATGMASELGRVAGLLERTVREETPLQRELDALGRILGVAVIAISVVVAATILLLQPVRSLDALVAILLIAVSLAVAAVPEGLAAVTTIVLSLGVERMARRNVIARRLSAVEALGSATVICSDKTGTLTRDEMTVRACLVAGGLVEVEGSGYEPVGRFLADGAPVTEGDLAIELERLLAAGTLANNARLVEDAGAWTVAGDPTEGALLAAARKAGLAAGDLEQRFRRLGEIPFSSERKRMSTAHADTTADGRFVLLTKGAPDVLLARCTHEQVGAGEQALTPGRRAVLEDAIDRLADRALRPLGVAWRPLARSAADAASAGALGEEHEAGLVWLGAVGMIDPPRPEAVESVRHARDAGVRTVMITGDHPRTALAIAVELAIAAPGEVAVTGAELEGMDDATLRERARSAGVYARVSPEHKLRIVTALQADGHVVAMTGDGVNDAPALKRADIGVAMGRTGTDVARGTADLILVDDNFASIVAAIEEGRAIYANIQKFLSYLVSSNTGEVLTMFLGVVLAGVLGLTAVGGEGAGLIVPLLPTMILWINLLTDAAPALALGVDPPEADLMRRPPRDPRAPAIDGPAWLRIAVVGALMAAGTLFVLDYALPGGLVAGHSDAVHGRSMAFTTLVLFQLVNVFQVRAGRTSALRAMARNRWLIAAIALSTALQAAVLYVPALQPAFGTAPLSGGEWLVCAAVACTLLLVSEVGRRLTRANADAPREDPPGRA